MFYIRRILSRILLVVLSLYLLMRLIMALTQYLIPVVVKVAVIVQFDSQSLIAHMQQFNASVTNIVHKLVIYLLVFITVVIIGGIIDACTGQLCRDIKSAQLARFLIRQTDSDTVTMNKREEKIANKWVRRARIVRWHKRLRLLIPCVGNSAVVGLIEERCRQHLVDWLSSNFADTHWTPMRVKIGGLFSWIIISEK